jgi:5-oxoprolinase (ATP-hydrolysing)
VSRYALCCFGGAGAQHACLVSEALGIKRILIHPHASLLSAYGIGLADIRVLHQASVELALDDKTVRELDATFEHLAQKGEEALKLQGLEVESSEAVFKAMVRYSGTDTALEVDF